MVMFEKNGQGYFDFDELGLLKITSQPFVLAIKRRLSLEGNKKIEVEQFGNEQDGFLRITIYNSYEVREYNYSFERKDYFVESMSYTDMRKYLAVLESGELDV